MEDDADNDEEINDIFNGINENTQALSLSKLKDNSINI